MNSYSKKMFCFGALVVLAFFLFYVFLTFTTPQTVTAKEQFQLSESALFWIRVSIVVPYFIMWFSAFFSVRALKIFSWTGGRFSVMSRWLSLGLLLLLAGAITTTTLGAVQGFLIQSTLELTPMLTVVINYAHAFFPLSAFLIMLYGIKKSDKLDSKDNRSSGMAVQSLTASIMIGLAYVPLVFTNPNRQIPFSVDTSASYYLPDVLIALTIVLPILASWAVGIFVALKLSRRFLELNLSQTSSFINGIFFIILSSMILQAILSLGSARLYEFGIGFILILVYILIFFQTAGYLMVAKGTRALERSLV